MDAFTDQDRRLWCERVPLSTIAHAVGAPTAGYLGVAIPHVCEIVERELAGEPEGARLAMLAGAVGSAMASLAADSTG